MSGQIDMNNKEQLNASVTLGVLLEYTDTFLIPKIGEPINDSEERIKKELKGEIKEANAALEHRLKTYIDHKLSDYSVEIFKRLDERYRKEKQFKQKVVELLRKHGIGSPEEVSFLDGLAQ